MDFLRWPVPEKIEFELRVIKLKMKKEFETSFGKAEGYRVILISKYGECTGFGEAPVDPKPLYNGEFVDSVVKFTTLVMPEIRAATTVKEVIDRLDKYRGNNFAKAMIEYSLLTLISCIKNVSLVKAVGGRPYKLPVQESIGIVRDEKALVKWAEEALSWGARRLKVKIMPGWDVEPVKALKREFPGVPILADANGAYDPRKESHWEYLSKVAAHVEAIEQPFPPYDLNFSAKLSFQEGVEVVIDESADSPIKVAEMRHIVETTGSNLGLNVKPPRFGGLVKSLEAIKIAEEAKMPVFVGGLLETVIGRSLNMVVASVIRERLEPSDFSPDQQFYERSLAKDPFQIKCGFVEIRDKPGIMFDIDMEYLDEVTIERKVL